jgi:ubiquitin-conjugating enzyme E2 S
MHLAIRMAANPFSINAVRCLLIEPFAESALNEEAGKLLLEDYVDFFKQAQLMTQIHAMPQKRPVPLGTRQVAGNTEPLCTVRGTQPPGQGCSSPVAKKAKNWVKPDPATGTAAAKKRALKRL